MTIDGKTVKETTSSTGPLELVGSHSGRVIKLNSGRHAGKMEYKYEADEDMLINEFTDSHYTQSMVAVQLPKSTVVHNYGLDKSLSLDSNGGFKSVGLNASLTLEVQKTILILYNTNLRVDGTYFSLRLRMGDKFNRKSILAMKDVNYGRGFGYVVRVLKPGTYSFDLDINTDSKSKYSPETADTQNISMQILEME